MDEVAIYRTLSLAVSGVPILVLPWLPQTSGRLVHCVHPSCEELVGLWVFALVLLHRFARPFALRFAGLVLAGVVCRMRPRAPPAPVIVTRLLRWMVYRVVF